MINFGFSDVFNDFQNNHIGVLNKTIYLCENLE